MEKKAKIYVAGHRGLVGGAIYRCLTTKGYTNIITRTHKELNLINQAEVNKFFAKEKPEYVFLAAAHVGGIGINSEHPAPFIYENMMIGFNIVEASRQNCVKKLLNLGSSCIYPKMAPQPLQEKSLLTGPLEPTNDAYAMAKISVIKLCQKYNFEYGTNFLSVMPTNLYGPGDNYDLAGSHVLPAMIRKFDDAKKSGKDEVILWGDGSPLREFLYSEDLADAIVYLMEHCNADDMLPESFVNVGSGKELTIKQVAEMVQDCIYKDAPGRICHIVWDTTKPNGTLRKLCDVRKLTSLGWTAKMPFDRGIELSYKDYLAGGGNMTKRQ
jgi:GDP-L-fucose synthase